MTEKAIDLSTEQGQIQIINQQKMKAMKAANGFGRPGKESLAGAIRITDSVPQAQPEQSTDDRASQDEPKQEATVPNTDTAPALSAADVKAMFQNMVNEAIAPVKAELETVKSEKQQAEDAAKKVQADLEAANTALLATKAELSKTEVAKQEAEKDAKTLEAIGKLSGVPVAQAQPMTILGDGSQESRNFLKLIESTPGQLVNAGGKQFIQRDTRSVDAYWRKNRNDIRDGVEAVMKEKGFLQGEGARSTNAITVNTDIPSIAFQYLSTFVRQNKFEDLIHWQFANTAAAPGTPPRLNTAVPRYPYNARPTAKADRTLTPGTAITSSTNNVTEVNALITILELGLGKDSTNAPIGVTEFTNSFSMVNLEQIIERNLGMDYQAFKDLCLYTEWFGTDTVVYPGKNGAVVSDPTTITNGDGATINRNFLLNLRSYMKIQRIPTYMDGYYGIVMNPNAIAQYFSTLTSQERFISDDQRDLVTRTFQTATGEDFGGVVSGYRGTHDGFHIFEQNVYGIGAGGTTGVTSTTLAGAVTGARLMETSFAFGRDTICWATAMPVEIRQDETTGFGRAARYLWISHENSGTLDVKLNSGTGSELRVLEIRSARVPV